MFTTLRKSISFNISLKIIVVYLCLTMGMLWAITHVVRQSFLIMENGDIVQSRGLVQRVLGMEMSSLSSMCQEYCAWDDTWSFLDGKNPKYVVNNLTHEYLNRSDLDLIIFLRADGSIAWSHSMKAGEILDVTPDGHTRDQQRLAAMIHRHATDYMMAPPSTVIVSTSYGPMMLAVGPVLHSNFSGIPHGFVIFGRLLDWGRTEQMAALTHTGLSIENVPSDKVAAYDAAPSSLIRRDTDRIHVPLLYRYLEDPGGMILDVSLERDMWKLGEKALGYLAAVVAVAGFVLVLVLIVIMRYSVLNPIKRLARHIGGVIEHEDLSSRIHTDRIDELGSLTNDYSRLLERIEARTLELNRANRELDNLASFDRLTGLANRRLFEFQANQDIAWLSREAKDSDHGGFLSLLLCDVDYFKLFNDTYGHLAGDTCLVAVGYSLLTFIRRSTDLACRYGGEEFVILLPDCRWGGAMAVAESIRAGIEGLAIPHTASKAAPVVTLSIGVAVRQVDADFSLEQLLEEADKALYRAKSQGRNQVVGPED
jgi:diguanylate cyclase (GGDEF)-like protein